LHGNIAAMLQKTHTGGHFNVWATLRQPCSKISNIAVTVPILQNNIAARLQQSSVL